MGNESDLTQLQRRTIELLQGRERAPFWVIQSELGIGTKATEELIQNMLHKDIIRTVDDPLSNLSNLSGTANSEADIQSLAFTLNDSYER